MLVHNKIQQKHDWTYTCISTHQRGRTPTHIPQYTYMYVSIYRPPKGRTTYISQYMYMYSWIYKPQWGRMHTNFPQCIGMYL